MTIEEITDKLDEINKIINGIGGRLLIFRQIPTIKEAHKMTIDVGIEIDDLINNLLEGEYICIFGTICLVFFREFNLHLYFLQ